MDDSFAGSGSEAPPPRPAATPPQAISERMQALMSRAEQEVAEQRQLQTLVGEVRHSLAQLQDDARRTAGSTTGLGERLEAVVRAVGAGAQVMQGIGNQVDRLLDLVTAQQQQLAALADAVASRDADTAAFDTLHRRLDAVAGEVHADSAASLHALAERIDNAVIALAEALIRPRTAAPAEQAPEPAGADAVDTVDAADAVDDDADVPTTTTMTMPVTATPWAGAAASAEPDEPADETADETADEPAAAAPADAAPGDADDAPETEAEAPADDEDVYVEEAMPATTAEDAVVEDTAVEEAVEDAVAEDTVEDDEPGEVPITGWSVDAPPEQSPSAWGWDADPAPAPTTGANDAGHDEHADKRRPWWRPGG